MMERKKNFIDFILDAQKDKSEKLIKGFLNAKTERELKAFFDDLKDYEITGSECKNLIKARKNLKESEKIIPEKFEDIV